MQFGMKYPKLDQKYKDQEFKVNGFWWPDFEGKLDKNEAKKKKLSGVLTYSPIAGTRLKLFHGNAGVPWGANIIHGEEGKGVYDKKITCIGYSYESGDARSTTYRVRHCLNGFHLSDVGKGNIKRISFSLKNLHNWIKCSGFSFETGYLMKTFILRYKEKRGCWRKLTDKLSFRVSQTGMQLGDGPEYGEVTAKEFVKIELQGYRGQKHCLSLFLEYMDAISDFYTIAAGDRCNPYSIYVTSAEKNVARFLPEKIAEVASFHSSDFRFSKFHWEVRKESFYFCEEDLEFPLRRHLLDWFRKYDSIRTPVALLNSVEVGEGYIESNLLTLCQAIESLHRNLEGGTYVSRAKYDAEVRMPLTAAIPDQLPKSFRDSLKTRFLYMNEFSLRKRLAVLINMNSNVLSKYIKNYKSLASEIADARNYFTHYPPDAKRPSYGKIQLHITILKVILHSFLLTQMGFSAKKIEGILGGCHRLEHIRYGAP